MQSSTIVVREGGGGSNSVDKEDSTIMPAMMMGRRGSLEHPISALQRAISEIDYEDASSRRRIEARDGPTSKSVSGEFNEEPSPQIEIVSWSENDPENPYNWSSGRKIFVVTVLCITVLNSTFGSSLPSNAIPFILTAFNVTSKSQAVLPISVYLIGYVLGPLFFGPLSEQYGRKWIMVATFCLFIVFTMGCALTPTWTGFLIFRLLCGVSASSPIAIVGGVYADIYNDPVTRGLAMAIFMAATSVGPLLAPILSGFVSPALGWRWTFWIGLIIAGACLPPLLFIPETYGPALLKRRAIRLRRTTHNHHLRAPIELEKQGFKQLATVTLTRPVRMLFSELIVAATCLYLSLAYAIFYMYFQAYPIVFQGIYHMSPGISGLMFLPVGIGALLALPIFIWYDVFLRRAKAANKSWTRKEEARRLPLACLGGPLYVIALFWMGWTARADVHWIVPCLAGLSFGIAYLLVFMALLNYLTDAYEIFAASAMAAASCCRSIFGAVLPLATTPMYDDLGVAWASSLLGFLSLAMCALPFVFLRWGEEIRARSRFCIYLMERKEKEERDEKEAREKIGKKEDC